MQRFSVFLTPTAEDFTWTGNLVRELCGKYGEPPFEPHVTVCSGTLSDLDALKKAVSAAAAESPFSLRVRGVGFSREYFRTLFMEFEEHPVLRRIHEMIRAEGGNDAGQDFFPHLSLLYRDMPLRDKGALARRVMLDKTEIRFDELKIVSPRNLERGWRDTGQWQTLFRVKLGKAGSRNL